MKDNELPHPMTKENLHYQQKNSLMFIMNHIHIDFIQYMYELTVEMLKIV